jgi:hypothetical protein
MGDAGLRRDKNETTPYYDYDSVIDHIVKIMVASARVLSRATDWQDHSLQGTRPRQRRLLDFDTRLDWSNFMEQFHNQAVLKWYFRMSAASFNKLANLIRHALEVDHQDMANLRDGSFIPEICLLGCLRYLAGGSYPDVNFFTGTTVSTASNIKM